MGHLSNERARTRVAGLVEEWKTLPERTLGAYFEEVKATMGNAQLGALEEQAHKTIHAFMYEVVTSGGLGDTFMHFEQLAEVERTPLNHLAALWELYMWAVWSEE